MQNDLHSLDALSTDQATLERVSPAFVREGLLSAREKTIRVTEEISREVRAGMTELEGRKLAVRIFADHGVTRHWHQPWVRFGKGTRLTFNDPLQPDYRLQENEPYLLDVGPVWKDPALELEYEGDYGDTFVLGSNAKAQACIDATRALFAAQKAEFHATPCSGAKLYARLAEAARQAGYGLAPKVEGHRVSDFPHQKFTKTALSKTAFVPAPTLWVFEVQLLTPDGTCGAFFEDLL